MKTLKEALDLKLINKVTILANGIMIFSNKMPNGIVYSWEYYCRYIAPKLSNACHQAQEASAETLEPQA